MSKNISPSVKMLHTKGKGNGHTSVAHMQNILTQIKSAATTIQLHQTVPQNTIQRCSFKFKWKAATFVRISQREHSPTLNRLDHSEIPYLLLFLSLSFSLCLLHRALTLTGRGIGKRTQSRTDLNQTNANARFSAPQNAVWQAQQALHSCPQHPVLRLHNSYLLHKNVFHFNACCPMLHATSLLPIWNKSIQHRASTLPEDQKICCLNEKLPHSLSFVFCSAFILHSRKNTVERLFWSPVTKHSISDSVSNSEVISFRGTQQYLFSHLCIYIGYARPK